MASYSFNYAFNVTGNCNAVVREISDNVRRLRERADEATSGLEKMQKAFLMGNQISQYFSGLNQTLKSTLEPGAALNASMAELQAISGAAGEELAQIEKAARSTAKEFGGSAAGAVESYKLLLSQLSPELTKNSEALNAMGRNVAILSKTMGGDTKSAAEVLTTAMNQYGVSLEDPMEASRKMAEMMNIMAAAGREGSAELPTIKVALEQCGMMAKSAGVSFAETNAAIQVLDKAGKKGSEGGVALRNVMSTLAQGRFLPKDVKEELTSAGVDILALTDKSKSLSDRLKLLQPVLKDDALFSKLFGKENSAAAMALVQGISQVEKWTEAISGTNTAVEQSQIIMETYNEKLARVQAKFDDIRISIFNSSGDFGIWVQVVASALIPISQLIPLITGAGNAILFLRRTSFGKAFEGVAVAIWGVIKRLMTMTAHVIASSGWFQVLKKSAQNAMNAITAKIRGPIISLMMLNTAVGFSGTMFTLFKVAAQNACRAISTAIYNIPLVGWIAFGITLVIGLVKLLWDKCKGFRVAVFTAWEAIKAIFNILKDIFIDFWSRVINTLSEMWAKIQSVAKTFAGLFMDIFRAFGEVASNIWNIIKKIAAPIISLYASVFNTVKGAVMSVVSAISDWFGKAADYVSNAAQRISGFVSGVWEAIKSLPQKIAGMFTSAVQSVAGFATNAWSAVKALPEKISTFIASVADSIRTWFESVGTYISNAFNSVVAWVSSLFGSIAWWVVAAFNTVADTVKNVAARVVSIAVSIWEAIKALPEKIAAFVATVFSTIRSWIESVRAFIVGAFNTVVGWITIAFSTVVNTVRNIAARIIGVAISIVNAIKILPERVVAFVTSIFTTVLSWIDIVRDNIMSVFDTVVGWVTTAFNSIVDAVSNIVSKVVDIASSVWGAVQTVAAKIGDFIGSLAAIASRVIAAIKSVWDSAKQMVQNVVDIYNSIVESISSVIGTVRDYLVGIFDSIITGIANFFMNIWGWLTNLASGIANFAMSVWDSIKAMGARIAAVFSGILATVRRWINTVRTYISNVVGAIVAKVKAVFAPLTTAFKNLATAVKGFFGGVIDWIRDKFYGLVNWFIDKYNYIAEKLDWDTIKRLGKEDADRSWAKDHPEQPTVQETPATTTEGTAESDGITPVDEGGAASSGSGMGGALGGVGGGASKETEKIKNINITIEKLIDTFTISTTNLTEGTARAKDMVSEALTLAVNDANHAGGE